MKQTAYLTIRLEIEDERDINPVNLCDELSIRAVSYTHLTLPTKA